VTGRAETSRSGPELRAATPADLEVMVGFSVAMARESENRRTEADKVREGIRRLLEDPALGRAFIAWDGETPAGMIMAAGQEWSEWRNGLFVWITGLYVAPAYRRQDLRSILYRHCRSWFLQQPEVIGLRGYVSEKNRFRPSLMQAIDYRVFEDNF